MNRPSEAGTWFPSNSRSTVALCPQLRRSLENAQYFLCRTRKRSAVLFFCGPFNDDKKVFIAGIPNGETKDVYHTFLFYMVRVICSHGANRLWANYLWGETSGYRVERFAWFDALNRKMWRNGKRPWFYAPTTCTSRSVPWTQLNDCTARAVRGVCETKLQLVTDFSVSDFSSLGF